MLTRNAQCPGEDQARRTRKICRLFSTFSLTVWLNTISRRLHLYHTHCPCQKEFEIDISDSFHLLLSSLQIALLAICTIDT